MAADNSDFPSMPDVSHCRNILLSPILENLSPLKKKTGQKTTHPCSKKVGRTFCTIKFPIQSLHCLWVRWQWCKVEISLSALKVAHIQIFLVPIDFPISVLSLSSSRSKCPLSPLGIWFTRECCITQRRKPTTVSTFLVLRRWG